MAPLIILLLATAQQSSSIVEGGMFAATPVALGQGQLLGPELSARLPGPLALGVRARLGFAAENDLDWHVRHTEGHLSALLAWVQPLGRAEVSLSLSTGGILLHEDRVRHQAARTVGSDLPVHSSALTAGVQTSIEGAVRLFFYDRYALSVNGGPSIRWVADAQNHGERFGVAIGLALAIALEDR